MLQVVLERPGSQGSVRVPFTSRKTPSTSPRGRPLIGLTTAIHCPKRWWPLALALTKVLPSSSDTWNHRAGLDVPPTNHHHVGQISTTTRLRKSVYTQQQVSQHFKINQNQKVGKCKLVKFDTVGSPCSPWFSWRTLIRNSGFENHSAPCMFKLGSKFENAKSSPLAESTSLKTQKPNAKQRDGDKYQIVRLDILRTSDGRRETGGHAQPENCGLLYPVVLEN